MRSLTPVPVPVKVLEDAARVPTAPGTLNAGRDRETMI